MSTTSLRPSSPVEWFFDRFGLRRNVVLVSLASSLFACGHGLWQQFRPLWLRALGANPQIIGSFDALREVADAAYQFPSGWLADRWGRRIALVMASALAMAGYLIWLAAPTWQVVFLGLPFVMAWSNPNGPIFATIGDTLPKNRRATGFAVQGLLPRLPSALLPMLGGVIIDSYVARDGPTAGVINGVRLGLAVTLVLAGIAVWTQWHFFVEQSVESARQFGLFHPSLRSLLTSEILIRSAKRLTDNFLPLFMRDVFRISYFQLGFLTSVARVTSSLIYLPGGMASDRKVQRKPLVLASFVLYALVPLVMVVARSWSILLIAFVMYGLRDVGEPARKAMITDMTDPASCGRTVGIYYFIRGPAIAPAAFLSGYLYAIAPQLLFYAAGLAGIAGTLLLAFTVKENSHTPPALTTGR